MRVFWIALAIAGIYFVLTGAYQMYVGLRAAMGG